MPKSEEQFAFVTLEGGGYTAVINPMRGANCIALTHEKLGADILRQPNYTHLDNPFLYGMPVLYPSNRISGGSFIFEGREYVFPVNEPSTGCHIHGFLHETPFALVKKSKSAATFLYEASEQNPYTTFPHAFAMEISYALGEKGLMQTTRICNRSNQNMPNILAFHTTFNVPFIRGSTSEDVRLLAEVCQEIERDEHYLPTGNRLPDDEYTLALIEGTCRPLCKKISRQYKAFLGGRVEMNDIRSGVRLVYELDEKFPFRLLYNGGSADYICIEPQTGMANCPNAPFDRREAGFDYIEAHGEKSYTASIYLKTIKGE